MSGARGYTTLSTYDPKKAPVPGKTVHFLGVPGATVAPAALQQPADQQQQQQQPQPKTFDRHDRQAVDASKGNSENVQAIQDELGLTGGNNATTTTPATNMPTRRRQGSQDQDTPSQSAGMVNQRRYSNLDDIARSIEELYPVESDDDKAKREKREKAQRVMAGIGDAFSAFKEAYDSARGKQVTPSKGNSRQLEDRLLALENVRKADAKSRIAALERLAQLQYNQEKGDQLAKYQEAQAKKWENEAKAQQERNDLQRYKLDIDSKYKEGLLDIKKEELEIKRQESEGKISHWQATERLQELRYRASQQPTTSHTVRTDKNGNYAGESTTVRTKGTGGGGNSTKKSGQTSAGGNNKNSSAKSKVSIHNK